jgi:hypothetical protein
MHLFLKNNIKIEGFFVWLIFYPVKTYQLWNMGDVFIFKAMSHFTLHLPLDIFEMTTNTSELAMELINRELMIFKRYEVDVKTSNVHFNGGKNLRICFLQLVFVLKKS